MSFTELPPDVLALLEQGERDGCLTLSEVEGVVEPTSSRRRRSRICTRSSNAGRST
jgi:hypothetical protein